MMLTQRWKPRQNKGQLLELNDNIDTHKLQTFRLSFYLTLFQCYEVSNFIFVQNISLIKINIFFDVFFLYLKDLTYLGFQEGWRPEG